MPPFLSSAVTVILELSESSDLIFPTVRCTSNDETCDVGVGAGGVVVSGDLAPPPPQAAITPKKDRDNRIFVNDVRRLCGLFSKTALLIFTLRKWFKR